MKILKIFLLLCTVLIILFIAKCNYALNQDLNRQSLPTPMPKVNAQGKYDLTVTLGEPYEDVYRHNPHMFEVSETGFGPSFMRPVLSFKEIPKIKTVLLGTNGLPVFEWENFADIRLVNDSNIPELGIHNFLGDFKPITEKLDDQQRYQLYAKIRSVLITYGWQAFTEPEYPRLFGQASWEIGKDKLNDGFYIDSYEKWQKYCSNSSIFVVFKKGNLIAEVSVSDILSSIEIETAESVFFFAYDENTRVEHWKEYLQRDIPKWAKQRAEEEAILKAKGVDIDERYTDYFPYFIK